MNKINILTRYEEKKVVKLAQLNFGNRREIWFKFPKQVENCITDRSDPFVLALIFSMMEHGGEFLVDGVVSKSLIDNVVIFSRIWSVWKPNKYKEIKIVADEIDDDYRPHNKKMITAFSGGLDASYTTYKYKKGKDNHFKYDVDKAVMIFGADIPLNNKDDFDSAFKSAKNMTDSIGVDLIPVETNYREYDNDWEAEFGTVVVSVLNFFSKKYFYGAASDASVHHFHTPWGMNPVTDRYLSNDTFRFISDGVEHSRTDRAGIIKEWEEGLLNLRVCWRNEDKSKNCGHCEKCIRTKLNFMAVGVNSLPSMPDDLTIKELLSVDLVKSPHLVPYYQEIYDIANKRKTISDSFMKILNKKIKKWKNMSAYKRRHHSLWWHIKHMKF